MQFNPQTSPDPPPLLSLEDVKGEDPYIWAHWAACSGTYSDEEFYKRLSEYRNTEPIVIPDPPTLKRQNGYVQTLPTIDEEECKWKPQPKRGRKRPYRMVNPEGRDRREEGDMEDDYKVHYCSYDKRTYRDGGKDSEVNRKQNEMDETVYELCKRPGALGF